MVSIRGDTLHAATIAGNPPRTPLATIKAYRRVLECQCAANRMMSKRIDTISSTILEIQTSRWRQNCRVRSLMNSNADRHDVARGKENLSRAQRFIRRSARRHSRSLSRH
jgi:hypothetical protein